MEDDNIIEESEYRTDAKCCYSCTQSRFDLEDEFVCLLHKDSVSFSGVCKYYEAIQ